MPAYTTKRRGKKPEETTLYDDATELGHLAWEDAARLAVALAPQVPADTEELDDFDQYNILLMASVEFSPGYWDDPDALTDLYKLKKKFRGVEDPELLEFAKLAREQRRNMPDPMMTPKNPEWEKVNRG